LTVGLPKVIKTNGIVKFKYALINSVDIELSFTIYKNILVSDCQRSIKFENTGKIIVIYCNYIFSYIIYVYFAI